MCIACILKDGVEFSSLLTAMHEAWLPLKIAEPGSDARKAALAVYAEKVKAFQGFLVKALDRQRPQDAMRTALMEAMLDVAHEEINKLKKKLLEAQSAAGVTPDPADAPEPEKTPEEQEAEKAAEAADQAARKSAIMTLLGDSMPPKLKQMLEDPERTVHVVMAD